MHEGYGAAAVRDGEVYVLDREDAERDVLRCYDLTTGKTLWTYSYEAAHEFSRKGSRNMPAVDMEKLIDVLLGVSSMACELPWIKEMDINPMIVDENGVVAVDARIFLTPSA